MYTSLFLITTLLIFPLSQIAIDIYLPSLPEMGVYFSAPNQLLQLSLTFYILALGISQFIYGPASDKYGRKPILLFGTFLFLIGTVCCLLSYTITQLLISRVIQGLGMGCGFVIGSAILGETFKGKKLAQMITASTTIYALSPLLIPVLGGYLELFGGWRLNFIFILFFTMVVYIMIIIFIPETNKFKNSAQLNIKTLFFTYKKLCTNYKFIGYILCSISGYGINITFNVLGPYLLQKTYHLSVVESGYILLITGLSYFIGTLINQKLLTKFSVDMSILIGLSLMTFFSLCILFIAYLDINNITVLIMFICLTIVPTGFIFSNCFTKALEIFPHMLGTASALIGSGGLLGVALISCGTSFIHAYNSFSIGYVFFSESIFGVLIYLVLHKCKTK